MSIISSAHGEAEAQPVTPAGGQPAGKKIEGRSPWRLAYERLRADRAAVISLVTIILIVLCAIFAPVFASITGHPPNVQYVNTGENAAGGPVPPSGLFWLGTDSDGRDLLVRIVYGARISLEVGVLSTLLAVALGTILGLAAGFFGRVVDTIIARIVDVMLSIPFLLLALSLAYIVGPSVLVVTFIIGGFSWAAVARIVRGQVMTIREKEYIEAARALGAGPWRIMIIDLLPNVIAQVIVYASLLIPLAIVAEAGLSFLGVGVPAPTADWGEMISTAGGYYQYGYWWFLFFPSVALLMTTFAFNIFGDSVRDAFDPRGGQLFV
jgi:peptide/nickel transport system permease protein